jgi:hypothetical protein
VGVSEGDPSSHPPNDLGEDHPYNTQQYQHEPTGDCEPYNRQRYRTRLAK